MYYVQAKVAETPAKQPLKLILYAIFLIIILGFAGQALSNSIPRLSDPLKLGPYATGFTTKIFTDMSRNRNGSTPTSPPAEGRPLYVAIWYPLKKPCPTCPLAQYSDNNPIYDGTHTGYPALSLPNFSTSSNGTVLNGPVNPNAFPLLIYLMGAAVSNTSGIYPLAETLASHGYIVASVEFTGNNFLHWAALFGGIDGGPGMSTQPGFTNVTQLLYGDKDVRFVISQMLNNSSDPQFASHIDPNAIGVFGYSFGGAVSTLLVSGFQAAGLVPDTRVKAAVLMDGTDYVGLTATDFANVQTPIMLYQDSDGQNPSIFPQLVNSPLKYFVDIAGAQHVPGRDPNLCSYIHQILQTVEANPSDPLIVGAGIFWVGPAGILDNLYQFCQPSVFNGVSDATLLLLGGDPTEVIAMKPLMPLRQAIPIEEFYRLNKWYIVSFFNKTLKNQNGYDIYLRDSLRTRALNPLVEFSKNCRYRPDNLMDLQSGDMITFTPVLDKVYLISMSHGNALLDKGTNNLNLGDDDSTNIALPFSFSMPNTGPFNHIRVSSNGTIVVSSLIYSEGLDLFDLPWKMRGEVMLNGQPTIAPLRVDLDPTAHGGVYAKVENNRVIITWDAVPVYTNAGNGDQNTMQVIINKNGIINLIYGAMSQTGPDYQPDFIGTLGVSTGKNVALEVQTDLVDFSKLKLPIILPSAFEQFYIGTGGTPCH